MIESPRMKRRAFSVWFLLLSLLAAQQLWLAHGFEHLRWKGDEARASLLPQPAGAAAEALCTLCLAVNSLGTTPPSEASMVGLAARREAVLAWVAIPRDIRFGTLLPPSRAPPAPL